MFKRLELSLRPEYYATQLRGMAAVLLTIITSQDAWIVYYIAFLRSPLAPRLIMHATPGSDN